jgi:hypothetical protein
MFSRLLVALAMALGLVAATFGPASATEAPVRLGLRPVGHDGTFFDLTLRPGERRELQVELGNSGPEPLEVRTYAADVYTIVNGGLGAELHDQAAGPVTAWLDYPSQRLDLPAGRGVIRKVIVEVPYDTEPGEYVTSLAIENAEPVAGGGSVAINQVNRVVIAVAITVPGPRRPALEIEDGGHRLVNGTSVLTFSLANSGNVHLRPRGEFSLRDGDGELISRAAVEMDTVFAGTTAALELPLANVLEPGAYCAALTLGDDDEGAAAAVDCLSLLIEPPPAPSAGGGGTIGGEIELPGGSDLRVPVAVLLGALLVVAAGLAGVVRLVRARRRAMEGWE